MKPAKINVVGNVPESLFSNSDSPSSFAFALSLGLKFIPTPSLSLSLKQLVSDWHKFKAVMKNRVYFLEKENKEDKRSDEEKKLYIRNNYVHEDYKSVMLPRYLLNTEKLLLDEINRIKQNRPRLQFNLPLSAVNKIRSLLSHPDVIIKPADKNMGLTMITREWYEKEAEKHLADQKAYRRVTKEEAEQALKAYRDSVKRIVTTAQQALYEYEKRWLNSTPEPSEQTIAKFYLLPKLHKSPVSTRPIISCVHALTNKASQLLDVILQPYVKKLETVLKDTKQLVQELEQRTFECDEETVLISADITSLFTVIPIDKGIAMVAKFLREQKVSEERVLIIVRLLRLVLKNNYFVFNLELFVQILGTAMGTAVSVAFANIYVYYNLDMILVNRFKPLLYKRFLDDILVMIKRSQLQQFLEAMNSCDSQLKVNPSVSEYSVQFLDLVVAKGARYLSEHKLDLSVYQKPMHAFLYLPPSSSHPPHTIKAWIRAELARFIRNSSSLSSYLSVRGAFFSRLIDRGYTTDELVPIFSSISYDQRAQLLQNVSVKEKTISNNTAFFSTFYSPLFRHIKLKSILERHLNMLETELGERTPKIMISWRRAANIGQLTVRAAYSKPGQQQQQPAIQPR
jgi:hypothetical protein